MVVVVEKSRLTRLLMRSEPYRAGKNAQPTTDNEVQLVPFAASQTSFAPYTSSAYESHIKRGVPFHALEATSIATPRNVSLAWDETEGYGIESGMRMSGNLSETDRKSTLYDQYINNVWISACVDVIAKRVTSGGWELEQTGQGKGKKANYDKLKAFFLYINPDEDCLQLVRAIITDLLIYGEAYVEIVRKGNVPYELHKIDCQTITYELSPHGEVTGYTQSIQNAEPVKFPPEDVIRFWFPSPRASKIALSPIERILNPVYANQSMSSWVNMFFKKGARPPFWVELPPGTNDKEAARFVQYLRENYTGQHNAHVPMVLYNGSKLVEVGKGSVDIDFLKGRNLSRDEILAGYGVPPALVGVIESGNIGGGTGESQEASFRYNTVDPVRQLVMEKINYRIVKEGFGITDYAFNTRYADYRDSQAIIKINDMRIRNGSATINEIRQEMGKTPYSDGGDVAVVVASKDILPVPRLSSIGDEQEASAQLDIATKKVQVQAQQKKLEEPPPTPGSDQPPADDPSSPSPKKDTSAEDEDEEEPQTQQQSAKESFPDFFVSAADSGGILTSTN